MEKIMDITNLDVFVYILNSMNTTQRTPAQFIQLENLKSYIKIEICNYFDAKH